MKTNALVSALGEGMPVGRCASELCNVEGGRRGKEDASALPGTSCKP